MWLEDSCRKYISHSLSNTMMFEHLLYLVPSDNPRGCYELTVLREDPFELLLMMLGSHYSSMLEPGEWKVF